MSNYRRNSNSISNLSCHIVWATKYRYHVLHGDIQKRCRDLVIQICNSENLHILKDVISIEVITWNYYEPIGIPYGSEKKDTNNNFPCKVKTYGVGLAYKRFIWKGAYSAGFAPKSPRYKQ